MSHPGGQSADDLEFFYLDQLQLHFLELLMRSSESFVAIQQRLAATGKVGCQQAELVLGLLVSGDVVLDTGSADHLAAGVTQGNLGGHQPIGRAIRVERLALAIG